MPHVFDTITSKDNPSAASQATNANRMIAIMPAKVKCEFRLIRVAITNSDNIMPSRNNRILSGINILAALQEIL